MKRVKERPFKKCLKCRIALNDAKSSRSKALYLFSVSESFLEKKARGTQDLPWRFSSWAPIAELDASTVRLIGASGWGGVTALPG